MIHLFIFRCRNDDGQEWNVTRDPKERVAHCLGLGLGGPGHSPVFGTPFGPNLNSVSVLVSVHPGHGSVSVLTSVFIDNEYAYLKRDKYINVH